MYVCVYVLCVCVVCIKKFTVKGIGREKEVPLVFLGSRIMVILVSSAIGGLTRCWTNFEILFGELVGEETEQLLSLAVGEKLAVI